MQSVKRFSVASWSALSTLLLLTAMSAGPAFAAVDQIQGDCAGTILGGPLNCTANSVNLAEVIVVSVDGQPVSGSPSCIAGTTIDVVVELGIEG